MELAPELALFDLDNTLLSGDSDHAWAQFLIDRGILEREASLHLSNVMLYDAKSQRGTRIGIRELPDGTRERVSKVSGETISKQ
mgnify:CR=1 FL=1